MSLRDAIVQIVEELEREAADPTEWLSAREIRSFVGRLKIALKASEGESPPVQPQQTYLIPEMQHANEIRKAREEFRRQHSSDKAALTEHPGGADLEEAYDGVQTHCRGGPSDDTWTTVHPQMPIGAKTIVSGVVYVLKQDSMGGRFLEFSAEETDKLKARLT